MLYHLFHYLEHLSIPGAGVFQYLSFRALMAVVLSLLISLVFGKRLIAFLQKKLIGETIRDLGLEGQIQKKGTPTMGGVIILLSLLLPTLLFADIFNVYVQLLIATTLILGSVGFADDYIKVFKKNKEGLSGRFKIIGQISVGIMVSVTLYFSSNTYVKTEKQNYIPTTKNQLKDRWIKNQDPITTIPFIKNNQFNYGWIGKISKNHKEKIAWLAYALIIIIVVTAVSNGANLTDGLDGLATGVSAVVGLTLGVLAYVSGNYIFADYLNIMFIPQSGELVIFIAAFVGACIGFLWYNSYPAQVFMGDTGSLTIGGIIAVFAIVIRKELLIPLLCGIFLIENLSVVLQVSWFKYTRKKYGEGRRIFLMSPLHHHYQKKGIHEAKIVARFWITSILLAVLTIITLKLR